MGSKAQEMSLLSRQSAGEMRNRLCRALRFVFPIRYRNPPAVLAMYPGHPDDKSVWVAPLSASTRKVKP